MRFACVILIAAVSSIYAVSIVPSVDRSAAVVEGMVISNTFVRVVEPFHGTKWQLWKAEVTVSRVIKRDKELGGRASLYYFENQVVCPMPPRVTLGMTKRFYCGRGTVDDDKDILMIPGDGWIEEVKDSPRYSAPSWPSFVPAPGKLHFVPDP
jgi:hypothetical protein